MQKVISLLIAVFAAVIGLQAQTKYENFTLGENQYLLGNSLDDKNYYTASSGNKGDVTMATRIAPENYKALKNARAVGIRFALPTAVEVKQVTLYTNSKSVKHKVTPEKVVAGWNYVPFDTPQTLSTTGVYVGYTYVQTTSYSCQGICHWDQKVPDGYWTCFEGQWMDWSSFYGALCIQLVVEADPLPDYGLAVESVDNLPLVMNEEGNLAVRFVSNSRKDISSFDYTMTVGEEAVTGHEDLAKTLVAGLNQRTGLTLKTPVMPSYGNYSANLAVTAINGDVLETPVTKTFTMDVVSRRAQRRTVVEENTGTGCGNCPRAWVGMEYLKEHRADNCIGIALHQYNSSDPMYCARYASLGFGGAAPLCKVDRKVMTDPYYGTAQLGIDRDVDYYSSIVPLVDVKVEGMFSADMKKVTCNAEVEWLTDTGKYTIAYVLLADGLQSTEPAWLQKNDYQIANASTQNILPHMQEYTQFFKGEANGQPMVSLVFNDVMIGSSYSTDGTNGAKALGATKHTCGEVLSHSYTCTIAASTAAKKVLDYDNIYVVALIIDSKGEIANAAKAKVLPIPEGIDTVLAPGDASDVSTDSTSAVAYDLAGRRISSSLLPSTSSLNKGITIVGGKKVIR